MNEFFIPRNLPVILIFLASLVGCRFGNHADQAQPIQGREYYKSIELFFTQPSHFETTVVLNSLSGTDSVLLKNGSAPLSSIPQSILNSFSDPVYFAIPNDSNRLPVIRDLSDTYGFDTELDPFGNIAHEYIPGSGPFILWNNPNCITNFQILHEGTFDRGSTGSITYPDGSTAPVAGRLKFSFTFSRIIASINGDENCTEDLTRLASCYQDGTGCSSSELSASRSLFDLYVKQTGVLKIEDAAKVKALEYKVEFE